MQKLINTSEKNQYIDCLITHKINIFVPFLLDERLDYRIREKLIHSHRKIR